MPTLGFDTATETLTVATTGGGDVRCSSESSGPGDDGRPRHSARLLAEIEACVEAAGGWERIDAIAVGLGPGLLHGPADRDRHRAGAGAGPGDRAARGSRPCRRWRWGSRSCPTPRADRRCRCSTPAAARPSRRSTSPAARPTGEPLGAGARRAGRAGPRPGSDPAGGRGRGATISAELEAAGATVAPDGDAVHRIAARHICALAAGRGAAAREADRADLFERARCKEMACKR